MQCVKPIIVPNGKFPCGKCIACRIQKSREWSCRLLHELTYWNEAVFVTLTYEDKYLPSDYSIHKRHLQLFFKRLRKALKGRKIKYFACGEYGDENIDKLTGLYKYPTKLGRPHYHSIIFGLSNLDKSDKQLIKDCWNYCQWSNFRDDLAFGSVTADSCRYVTDYIFKKYDNKKAADVYLSVNCEIPFKLASQGLGLQFALDNADNIKHFLRLKQNGHFVKLPRYYVEKLGIELEPDLEREKTQWENYVSRYHYHVNDIGALQLSHARQRLENLEKNIEIHKKGKI